MLEASPFHGEGYRKAWAKLRVEGIRTSQERVRRLMREHDLQAPHRMGQAHGPKAHDGTITTEAPDVMWGTDMTATMTVGEGAAFRLRGRRSLYDRVHRPACRQAREPVRGLGAGPPGCPRTLWPDRRRASPAGCGSGTTTGRTISRTTFQQEVAFFGIESSPSFVREPEGNGVAERFIRTLKGESVVGAELRHHRGAPPGLA